MVSPWKDITGAVSDQLRVPYDIFSADRDYCSRRFPVVCDADRKIANSYHLRSSAARAGMTDVRGDTNSHDFIERGTFAIGEDHKIIAMFSSKDDHSAPDEPVEKSLAIVQ